MHGLRPSQWLVTCDSTSNWLQVSIRISMRFLRRTQNWVAGDEWHSSSPLRTREIDKETGPPRKTFWCVQNLIRDVKCFSLWRCPGAQAICVSNVKRPFTLDTHWLRHRLAGKPFDFLVRDVKCYLLWRCHLRRTTRAAEVHPPQCLNCFVER